MKLPENIIIYNDLFNKDYSTCVDTDEDAGDDMEDQTPQWLIETIGSAKKAYWHELSKEEQNVICTSKVSIGTILDSYLQPDWCCYFKALEGIAGCWSLMFGHINQESDCTNCELYTNDPKNKVFV